jgi:hypothetical protein
VTDSAFSDQGSAVLFLFLFKDPCQLTVLTFCQEGGISSAQLVVSLYVLNASATPVCCLLFVYMQPALHSCMAAFLQYLGGQPEMPMSLALTSRPVGLVLWVCSAAATGCSWCMPRIQCHSTQGGRARARAGNCHYLCYAGMLCSVFQALFSLGLGDWCSHELQRCSCPSQHVRSVTS